MNSKPTTIYIVGPTASGKTALSIELAQILQAEIICADSQTVRRDMNIGTAKPSPEEQQGVPHHMLDVIDPYQPYSLNLYQQQAHGILDDIHSRGKTAIITGGTGLYIDALYFNFSLPMLTELADQEDLNTKSVAELQRLIQSKDLPLPENTQNQRHLVNTIIRAGQMGTKSEPDPNSIIIGINPGRGELLQRINRRVEKMFEEGFVDEVRSIIKTYGNPPKSFDAIGYRLVARMLNAEITEQETKELFKVADRQYAKRQLSWFKRNNNIIWFESPVEAKNYILDICLK